MMSRLRALFAAALLTAMPAAVLAAPAGSALGVKPQAAAKLSGETRTLVVGADIFIGDLVQTGPGGQVQIMFADRTELVVGPSSALTIEDYLIRNDGSAGKLAVDLLSGAFRFATGDSAKNRYTLSTPTGTIGVRGTEFDIWIGQDGVTYVLRHGGTVILCDRASECDVLDDICEVGQIRGTDVAILGDSRRSTGDTRSTYKRWFRYSENQSPLLRQFWFARARDCLNTSVSDPRDPADSNTNNDSGGGRQRPSFPQTDTPPTTPFFPTIGFGQ